jgi:hypothetical protein
MTIRSFLSINKGFSPLPNDPRFRLTSGIHN